MMLSLLIRWGGGVVEKGEMGGGEGGRGIW